MKHDVRIFKILAMLLRVHTHAQKETKMQLTDLLMRLVDGQNFTSQESHSLAGRTLSEKGALVFIGPQCFLPEVTLVLSSLHPDRQSLSTVVVPQLNRALVGHSDKS